MKRCTHPDCGGTLFSEPADNANVGPTGVKRTQLICTLCGRVPAPPEKPLPLVASYRITPAPIQGEINRAGGR